jgi:hypothetical protein
MRDTGEENEALVGAESAKLARMLSYRPTGRQRLKEIYVSNLGRKEGREEGSIYTAWSTNERR